MSEKVEAILQYIALAVFAGAIGHMQRVSAEGKPVKFWRVALEAAGAGLVGYILMLLCIELGLSPNWTGVVVGTGGWLGASASIRIIERYVFRKLGVTDDDFNRVDRNASAKADALDRVRTVGSGDSDDSVGNQPTAPSAANGDEERVADERL